MDKNKTSLDSLNERKTKLDLKITFKILHNTISIHFATKKLRGIYSVHKVDLPGSSLGMETMCTDSGKRPPPVSDHNSSHFG